jgi:LCP family protein required for cell wall assembly
VLLAAAAGVVAVLLLAVVVDAAVVVPRVPTVSVTMPGSDDGTTYLLAASDSRDRLDAADRDRYADRHQPAGERADLVLLLRRDAQGGATLYSLPRDLYVGQRRGQPHRLGLALQEGPQALVDSLCADLGIGVDHVVVVDMAAVVELVDATGGVTVSVDEPTRDVRARLDLPTPGSHHLDGRGALAWVRSRHPQVLVGGRWTSDLTADLTRTTHAKDVLTQVVARLDDPITVQRVGWQVGPRLRRDGDLGARGVATLGRSLRDALAAGREVTVPARARGTAVPFAFVTPATTRALAPQVSDGCTAPPAG